jgi:DNA-binding LacI/PurR family transcriptional regulator
MTLRQAAETRGNGRECGVRRGRTIPVRAHFALAKHPLFFDGWLVMSSWQRVSAVAQLAAHLREQLAKGRWSGKMPGVIRLAEELAAARNTVEAALRQLEREGLLLPQGHGRGRLIRMRGGRGKSGLRVAILPGDVADRGLNYLIELEHELAEANHQGFFTPDSLDVLGMNVRRIARMADKVEADAWVVVSASRAVLEWFAARDVPALALFGRRKGVPIAGVGPDKRPAMTEATRALIGLGHRRIVLLSRSRRRLPTPGASEQTFLNELAAHGISPGEYHLPDWEETAAGFQARLDLLFRVTPPTALIVDEAPFFVAALNFCASRGLRVPRDISMVCTDADPAFDWCSPAISHIRWDSRPVVRRIVKWVNDLRGGKHCLRQALTTAEFMRGGTIGRMGGNPARR